MYLHSEENAQRSFTAKSSAFRLLYHFEQIYKLSLTALMSLESLHLLNLEFIPRFALYQGILCHLWRKIRWVKTHVKISCILFSATYIKELNHLTFMFKEVET